MTIYAVDEHGECHDICGNPTGEGAASLDDLCNMIRDFHDIGFYNEDVRDRLLHEVELERYVQTYQKAVRLAESL
jgi:hypothetical protein